MGGWLSFAQPHFETLNSRAIDSFEVGVFAVSRIMSHRMILAKRISHPRDDPWLADLPSRPHSADMAFPVGLRSGW